MSWVTMAMVMLEEIPSAIRIGAWKVRLALCAAFAALMFLTNIVNIGGDTTLYAAEISSSMKHGWSSPELWNFAHVLWRPLGLLLSQMLLSNLLPNFGGNEEMGIAFLLTVPNIIGTLVCVLMIESMVWRLTGRVNVSAFTAFAFLCANCIFNLARWGSPYPFGLACILMALYVMAFRSGATWRSATLAGILGATATLVWIPYVLSLPALLICGYILNLNGERKKLNLPAMIAFCMAGGVVLAVFYGIALSELQITGIEGFRAWVRASQDGSAAGQRAIRMVNGLARSFYETGDDAVWIKWYLFHDPYAKVSIGEVLRVTLVPLAMFYSAMAGLLISLPRTTLGRKLLLLLALAAAPNIALALAFESGDPYRYQPFLPYLFLGFGYVIGSEKYPKWWSIAVVVLCCLHVVPNLLSGRTNSVSAGLAKNPQRTQAFLAANPKDRFVVVNRDVLFALSYGDPLNALHKKNLAVVSTVLPPSADVKLWRVQFACNVATTWNQGGQNWVSTRVLADKPPRDWKWVDGDVGVFWKDLQNFFSGLPKGQITGGADGFFLLPDQPEVRATLTALIAGQTCAK